MSFLSSPHLDLTTSRIETARCVIVPFSLDGRVDIHELTDEFCRANKDLWVSEFLPNYDEERAFVTGVIEQIERRELFENFILEKETGKLIWCIWLNKPDEHSLNYWLWICEDEHGKWYGSETYAMMLEWARENISLEYLRHWTHPDNIASHKLAQKFGGILQKVRTPEWYDMYYVRLR